MARAELSTTVMNPTTGLPVNGASVAISQRAGGAAVTWFSAETGGSGSTSPVVTDSSGRASAWVARGAYNLTVSGAGITTYVEPWDAIPASDGGGDTLWLPDASVANAKLASSGLDASKLTTGNLPSSAHGNVPGSALAAATIAPVKMAAGSRFLSGVDTLPGNLVVNGTLPNMATVTVTHNAKPALVLAAWHGVSALLGTAITYTIKLDGTTVATYVGGTPGSAFDGMACMTYTSGVLSAASHTWVLGASQTGAGGASTTTFFGQAIMIVLEQY